MNKWVGLTLGLLLCLSSGAKAEESTWQDAPVIISYEDFSRLTHAEQLTYVKRLQQVMIEIDERDPQAAAMLLQKVPFFAELMGITLPRAFAEENTMTSADLASVSITAAEQAMDVTSKVVRTKKISPAQQNGLWDDYRSTLQFIGMAGQHMNNVSDPAEKAKLKKQVDDLWASVSKKQADVIRKMPTADREAAKKQFDEIAAQYVVPSIAGKISPTARIPDFVIAKSLAESKAATQATAPSAAPVAAAANPTAQSAATTKAAGLRDGGPKNPFAPSKSDAVADMVDKAARSTYGAGTDLIPSASSEPKNPLAPKAKFAGLTPHDGKKTMTVTASTEASAKTTATTATTSSAPEKVTDKRNTPQSKWGKISPPKAPVKAAETAGELFRCMHSGFVIKGDKCMAPRTLPFDLVGIDKAKFECRKGTVMCNPFIFGVESEGCDWEKAAEDKTLDACWKNAKPICGVHGTNSTEECARNNKRSIESAVELIHANNKVFSLFGAQMKKLCSKDNPPVDYKASRATAAHVRADITRTCNIAKKAADAVLKRFNIRYSKAKMTPETAAYLQQNGFDVPPDEIDKSGKGSKTGEAAAAAAAAGSGTH